MKYALSVRFALSPRSRNVDVHTILWTVVLGLMPISELRGAIPYGYLSGMPLGMAVLLGAGANLLICPLLYLFLSFFHQWLYRRWRWYANIFDRSVARAQKKLAPKVQSYGLWGVILFVGIPLPFTGAWTGTLGAWILGLDRKRSILAVSAGVFIAAGIVSLVLLAGKGAGSLFLKTM